MAYKSSYTGPQIDQAVGNALNKDTSTLSNDVNHIPASSVVKSALNSVEDDISIRVVGNKTTYASGAAIGQYVIVSGSTIAGISDGMYKAAKAIPYNTTIDNTYLTAVSGGGMNDLKAAFATSIIRIQIPNVTARADVIGGYYGSTSKNSESSLSGKKILAVWAINDNGLPVLAAYTPDDNDAIRVCTNSSGSAYVYCLCISE